MTAAVGDPNGRRVTSAGAPTRREGAETVAHHRNVRLRDAMSEAEMTYRDLAEKVGCNLKTAQRWVNEGRVPHRRHASRVAQALAVSMEWLWPSLSRSERGCFCNGSVVEIAVPLGRGVQIAADDGDDPPVLWIRSRTTALSILPEAIVLGRQLDRDDLETASAIVMAAVAYRTAILTDLQRTGVVTMPTRPYAYQRKRVRRSL
jgi:transcriptional regulator with XRE-family HTH domain